MSFLHSIVPANEVVVNQDGDYLEAACEYFKIFKGIVVDIFSNFNDFAFERPSFGNFDPEKALRIIEIELNFVYEVLQTKIQLTTLFWELFCGSYVLVQLWLPFQFSISKLRRMVSMILISELHTPCSWEA